MIDGVIVKPLKVIPDERGWLMEMLRADDPFFQKFGQCYLTVVYPGVVKGWHYHKKQTDHFVCVQGHGQGGALRPPRGLAHPGRGERVLHGRAQPHPAGHPGRRAARHEGHRHRDRP